MKLRPEWTLMVTKEKRLNSFNGDPYKNLATYTSCTYTPNYSLLKFSGSRYRPQSRSWSNLEESGSFDTLHVAMASRTTSGRFKPCIRSPKELEETSWTNKAHMVPDAEGGDDIDGMQEAWLKPITFRLPVPKRKNWCLMEVYSNIQ